MKPAFQVPVDTAQQIVEQKKVFHEFLILKHNVLTKNQQSNILWFIFVPKT